ncbi:MAG: hypothetical protein AVDCRST_MAG08-1242 [uncultured Acetobacteraceae bacterium]|jgi:hypothetical protein|uniref:DUF6285 domain-containing protein n=1 Tax=uncultured Acetobacteraceae bacterium TaxID=169975 RepID=A0A6J4HTB7_9PROT|nr:MAG: hypothetical protein AVDCRST_MAG08-1242 [uncultured Acetobacteraceae bacterium]
MLERPDAAGLLETAREVLLRELLPHLPEERRFEARMVANAMAIARRGMAADAAPALDRLRCLLDVPDAEPDALLRRLAAEIRAGERDPDRPGGTETAEALVALARLRCSVSNPRALGR